MRNPARDEADRWTTALGVPAGTSPEAVKAAVEEALKAAWYCGESDGGSAAQGWTFDDDYSWERSRVCEEIRDGEHVSLYLPDDTAQAGGGE